MKIFELLINLREFQKQNLPQLISLEDFDIVRLIGYHEDAGTPLTLKALILEGVGSVATVQRRLRRLTRLGVVVQRRATHDRRNLELYLSPGIRRIYSRKRRLLRSA